MKVGDRVICVDATGYRYFLVTGREYVITDMHVCKQCSAVCVHQLTYSYGPLPCGHQLNGPGFNAWRFIKLDGLKEEQEQEKEAI